MSFGPFCQHVCLPCLLSAAVVSLGGAPAPGPDDKPSVSIRVSPVSGFAPLKAVITAELKGGADDYEEFYCPTVEWDISVTALQSPHDPIGRMSDSRPVQKSEQKLDCDPYEKGKTEIKRRFVRQHTFKTGGEYTVRFSLKQDKKTVASQRVTVRVRGGVGDGIGFARP